jgi:hypothetical protein
MVDLIHGEEFSEMHECRRLLGVFYDENSRPEYALNSSESNDAFSACVRVDNDLFQSVRKDLMRQNP